jgi:hypothetical protein
MTKTLIGILTLLALCTDLHAQHYRLERRTDSLSVLLLETCDATGRVVRTDRWRLPYPVYQWCEGDVDGDGLAEAFVGVVKRTRFSTEMDRRLFVFHNVKGHIRPLWMGTRLGGRLVDFRFVGGRLRSLERSADGQRFAVAEYGWSRFGPAFERYLTLNSKKDESMQIFEGR